MSSGQPERPKLHVIHGAGEAPEPAPDRREPHGAPSVREQLSAWLAEPPGSVLLQAEDEQMRRALHNLFGYHLVQLGTFGADAFLSSSRISHRAVLDIDPPRRHEPARAVCSAEALPLAADSVDVLVLPHVLEFEQN